MLTLDRPLVVFDLEATGTDPSRARIIQIAARRLVPGESGPMPGRVFNQLVNPRETIPDVVVELTGITNADVQDAPLFPDVVADVQELIGDADLAGFNVHDYDLPLLQAEYDRVGHEMAGPDDREVIDVLRLEKVLRPRSLEALYKEYTGNELSDAHDASADVDGTLAVLAAQLEEHRPPVSTPKQLADFIRGEYLDDGRRLKRCDNGEVEICFGKHSGKTLTEVYETSPGYVKWMRREITELRPHIDDALS